MWYFSFGLIFDDLNDQPEATKINNLLRPRFKKLKCRGKSWNYENMVHPTQQIINGGVGGERILNDINRKEGGRKTKNGNTNSSIFNESFILFRTFLSSSATQECKWIGPSGKFPWENSIKYNDGRCCFMSNYQEGLSDVEIAIIQFTVKM